MLGVRDRKTLEKRRLALNFGDTPPWGVMGSLSTFTCRPSQFLKVRHQRELLFISPRWSNAWHTPELSKHQINRWRIINHPLSKQKQGYINSDLRPAHSGSALSKEQTHLSPHPLLWVLRTTVPLSPTCEEHLS